MRYSNARPVLRRSDDGCGRAFSTDVPGFEINQEAVDPITGFGILRADKMQVNLTAWDGPEASYERWRIFSDPDEFTATARHFKSTGTLVGGPVVTKYGMHESEVTDSDDAVIGLGEDAT